MIPRMIRFTMFVALAVLSASAQSTPFKDQLESVFPDAYALYLDLHQHPELSSHETRTAALLAQRLRQLGYEVTENVGGTGVVGIMKNGSGPTVVPVSCLPTTQHVLVVNDLRYGELLPSPRTRRDAFPGTVRRPTYIVHSIAQRSWLPSPRPH
jgi:hypothetical protein